MAQMVWRQCRVNAADTNQSFRVEALHEKHGVDSAFAPVGHDRCDPYFVRKPSLTVEHVKVLAPRQELLKPMQWKTEFEFVSMVGRELYSCLAEPLLNKGAII